MGAHEPLVMNLRLAFIYDGHNDIYFTVLISTQFENYRPDRKTAVPADCYRLNVICLTFVTSIRIWRVLP